MPRFVPGALAMLAVSLAAQTPFLSVKDIRAGMHGTGRTVFSGTRIDEFQVEILGVLENVGPKESLILARLSGGPLEQTGVMEGMSGSPVYIDGKLVGAVAMAFPFS
ncbi:MAG: SpoIVB peptidase S55 domain-containing protein, partial [Bryobacteraceae bacterium]